LKTRPNTYKYLYLINKDKASAPIFKKIALSVAISSLIKTQLGGNTPSIRVTFPFELNILKETPQKIQNLYQSIKNLFFTKEGNGFNNLPSVDRVLFNSNDEKIRLIFSSTSTMQVELVGQNKTGSLDSLILKKDGEIESITIDKQVVEINKN
jgi:hypothetical protein